MKYRGGYKYQLAEDETFQTNIKPQHSIFTARIDLYTTGLLVIREGYSWDGTSGPVIDRKTNQRGSLAHDALYQLMRMELLPHYNWPLADQEFAKCIKEDGAWDLTAKIDLIGLKLAKGRAALPKNRKKVYEAP